MEFMLSFLAADRFHYTPLKMRYLFVFSGLIIVVVQGGLIRELAPVYGEKALAITGLLVVIPGFVLVTFAAREGMLYLGIGFMAFGSALITPSASALVSLYTPSDRQGSILGIFRSLGALARAVGPLLACAAYWRFGSRAAYGLGAALILAPLCTAFFLPALSRDELNSSPDSKA